MSSPSAFWAQKRDLVASADSPSPTFAELPKPTPAEASSTKQGFVMKGMTNGASKGSTQNSSNGKKTDWADSEDDEDFLRPFTENPRIITLEHEVAQKDARIGELEAVIGTKNVRIGELEELVDGQDYNVASLQAEVEGMSALIDELNKASGQQLLHVQELVAEVDEKDRRIDNLETELDKKGAIIRALEMEVESNKQASAKQVEAKKAEEAAISPAEPTQVKDDVAEVGPTSPSGTTDTTAVNALEPEAAITTATESATLGESKQTPVSREVPAPAFEVSDFPLFATPAKIKVAPPHKVPKKLNFPIDFSKYGKKSAVVAKQPEPQKGKVASSTFGLASKQQRAKTDEVPKFNPSLDIRQMPHSERVLYANGPEVIVTMGDVTLATIPKYVLMQCSITAYKYFTEQPHATSITFPANSMDTDAAKVHLTWMDEMTYQGRVYSVTLNTDSKSDQKNLKICRAARVLGLNNTYVGHFTKQMCDRIRNNAATAEFLGLVCDLAYSDNDPIFECLANNLVNQLQRKTKKPEELAALLAKHENLKKKMEAIEQRTAKKRKS